ncbi:MAG TPA: fused MFS/spermidine synthase, partial [Gemmatales bacterium]|nr:fused MFS/spermidine synthase [Gemmatales bacterium]
MRSGTLFAYFVTFSASFCIMVIELVAGRIMAPYIGQHLYSWTSIIGVCLAGISVGAWLGGWLADRFPYRAT